MPQHINLTIEPEALEQLPKRVARQLGVSPNRIQGIIPLRRSIDARGRHPRFNLRLQVWVDEPANPAPLPPLQLESVANAPPVHIIGMGPAGLFAAIELIQQGYKPIIIERGKEVRGRRRDLARITREGLVNPDSNYCFGEGGAGTFSDGKLYTRSTKRGKIRPVLEAFVHFGATPEILVDAHPHIGTNKLPRIIERMREEILSCGGEVRFSTRLTDLKIEGGKLTHIQLNGDEWEPVRSLVLATGHSARDIFRLLHTRNVPIEAKPFALGLRVEHPQPLIDQIQYHVAKERHPALPAASYSLVQQVFDRGVYSFCMCPGGIICPAATEDGEVVVNGWSPSKRNSPFANSGMVVELALSDFGADPDDPLRAMAFQAEVEKRAFKAGGGKQVAPAARLSDFVRGKVSRNLPDCSYLPGLEPVDLSEVLPDFVYERLKGGFKAFGRRLKGYLTEEAVVVGVESRTSSPVRIPRDRENLMHPGVEGLYPCGEGAGYAGGIMSAALDGQRVAKAIAIREES